MNVFFFIHRLFNVSCVKTVNEKNNALNRERRKRGNDGLGSLKGGLEKNIMYFNCIYVCMYVHGGGQRFDCLFAGCVIKLPV